MEKTYINTKMELSIDMVKMFQCIGCYEISNTYIEYGVLLIVFGIQMQEIIVHIFHLDLDHTNHFCTRMYFMYSENVCFQHYPVAKHIWNISDMSSR